VKFPKVAAVTWESAKVLRLGLITLSFQEKRPQSTSILLTEFPPAASSGPPCPPRKCCIWKGHWVFRLWQICLYLVATTGTFFSTGSLGGVVESNRVDRHLVELMPAVFILVFWD
jgi:hypothetical protein